jgi:F-type H+-transporting ATPase subunit gamma
MANLKDIQRQIKSVSNTQKTTRAMKLVSTAKLRRAEELARRSRLYADKMNQVIAEIAGRIKCNKIGGIDNRSFMKIENPAVVDIVFVTADKGLCGGFNIQTIKAVSSLMEEYKDKKVKVRLRGVGKKGVAFFKFQDIALHSQYAGVSSAPTYEKAREIIAEAIDDFMNGVTDKVILVHNGYLNMISQELKVTNIAPVMQPGGFESDSKSLMELEPEEDETILESLMKKYFEYNMYYALIDSLAAEHSARMQAMENATNNATERVQMLTLAYNKARQESITTELIEIISGVESMK